MKSKIKRVFSLCQFASLTVQEETLTEDYCRWMQENEKVERATVHIVGKSNGVVFLDRQITVSQDNTKVLTTY